MSDANSILPSFGAGAPCAIEIDFYEWSHVFVVVGFAYFWNLSLILWSLPWNIAYDEKSGSNYSFPYLGSTLSVMFESPRFGISMQNWRQLGKKRIDENNIFSIVDSNAFKYFVFIFTLNSWILFAAKFCMFLTFKSSFYDAWNGRGFTDFFNIEIALVTLLMISNIFFSFPLLPSFQIASTKSTFVLCCLYLLYIEIMLTFILLCIQYPLLISVLYIGACIILTGMILGMAILCLLAVVTVSGFFIYWTLNVLTALQLMRNVERLHILRAFSASFTWLLITYLVWVSGICLSFLFTTSEFQSKLCIDTENSLSQKLCMIFIILSIAITAVSLLLHRFICAMPAHPQHKYQKVQQQDAI